MNKVNHFFKLHRLRTLRLCSRVWEEDPAWAMGLLGAEAFAVGLFVALPFETTTPPFTILGHLMPEFVWGALLCLGGAWQLGFACVECHRRRSQGNGIGALLGIVTWGFLALFTVLAQPRAVVAIFYALSALTWLLILRKLPLEWFDRAFGWMDKVDGALHAILRS